MTLFLNSIHSTPVSLAACPIPLYPLTVAVRLMPPLSFFLKPMLGGLLFKRRPKPSNSFSMIFLCPKGFRTSRTIRIKLHVRATEELKNKSYTQAKSIKDLTNTNTQKYKGKGEGGGRGGGRVPALNKKCFCKYMDTHEVLKISKDLCHEDKGGRGVVSGIGGKRMKSIRLLPYY